MRTALLLLPLALAACGRGEDDGDPHGLTPAEEQRLNDAARATDSNTINGNATEESQ